MALDIDSQLKCSSRLYTRLLFASHNQSSASADNRLRHSSQQCYDLYVMFFTDFQEDESTSIILLEQGKQVFSFSGLFFTQPSRSATALSCD